MKRFVSALALATFLVAPFAHAQDKTVIIKGQDVSGVKRVFLLDATGAIVVSASASGIYAEDSIHTDTDLGQLALGVRLDVAAATAGASGDYQPFIFDANGKLWVNPGTTATEFDEDTQHNSGDKGGMMLAVRNDAGTSLVDLDGDYAPLMVNASGMLNINFDQIRDTAPDIGSGAAGAGTLRVSMATDDIVTVSATDAANLVTNPMFVQLSNGAAAFLDSTAAPGYIRFQDGDSTVVADVLDTLSAGQATTLNGLWTASAAYGFNGTNFDPVKISATDAWMANVENWPSAFSPSDGWVSTNKVASDVWNTTVQSTAAIGAAATDVLSSKEVGGWPNVTIYLKNTDGADPFTDADILVSPNNTDWIILTAWTSCDALAAGGMCEYQISGNSYRYVKAQVTGAAGNEVSVDAYLTANQD